MTGTSSLSAASSPQTPTAAATTLAAYLTDLLVDLTGDELATLPSAPPATLPTSTEGT